VRPPKRIGGRIFSRRTFFHLRLQGPMTVDDGIESIHVEFGVIDNLW